jgi:hypothetical protein
MHKMRGSRSKIQTYALKKFVVCLRIKMNAKIEAQNGTYS